jgi:hypothetical protein
MYTREKLLPHQFERARKTLSFLKYWAPSFQKTPLLSCCVKNTTDTSQFGEDVADTTRLKKRICVRSVQGTTSAKIQIQLPDGSISGKQGETNFERVKTKRRVHE